MTGKNLASVQIMPGESVDAFWGRALNAVFADAFVEEQTEAGVRKRIERGDFKYAVRLMKDWHQRKPEDIETLRSLKAYLVERRNELRAVRAGYARTYRRKKRAERAETDNRVCAGCGASLAGKRAGALTCSTKCRVKVFRMGS